MGFHCCFIFSTDCVVASVHSEGPCLGAHYLTFSWSIYCSICPLSSYSPNTYSVPGPGRGIRPSPQMMTVLPFFPPNLISFLVILLGESLLQCWIEIVIVGTLFSSPSQGERFLYFPKKHDVCCRFFVPTLYQIKEVPFHS